MATIDVSTQLETLLRLQQDLALELNVDRVPSRIDDDGDGTRLRLRMPG